MMTGFLHEKAFSRKSFVKGGGALIVGFSAGAALAGRASAVDSPFSSNGGMPSDGANPGTTPLNQVDTWISINADNTALIKTGRVELGQGNTTGLLLIAAEELDMDMSQLTFARNDTNTNPDTGLTAGSSSIATVGPELRSATANAKQALLAKASANLGVPVAALSVSKGVVSGGGKTVTYGQLVGGQLFNITLATQSINGGVAPSKPISSYSLVGISRIGRVDIPAKVTGTYTFIHNVRVPGMLHGRLVRPRGQGAYGDGTAPQILSVDPKSVAHLPNVKILQRSNFLGVVAPREFDAIQAAAQLKVKWAPMPPISGIGNIYGQMRTFDSAGKVATSFSVNTGNVDTALASAAHTIKQSYDYAYNGHMPIGPACAVADVTPTGALVMANTQSCYAVRTKLQPILNLPINMIRVQYYEGASSFGNSPARYDSSQAAAVLSQLAGAPVRLQFMRWDEHGWDNYGPAQLMDIAGGVDGSGNITALQYTQFAIPGISQTLDDPTRQQVGIPLPPPGVGAADANNSGTQYNIPNRRVISKSLPLFDNYFKTSSLRAPQAPQTCFGSEQMIDELAHAAGMDPYQFRLQNISTTQANQWHDALVAVAQISNWQPRVSASNLSKANIVTGRGIALGGFAGSQSGAVVEVEVNKTSGKITVKNSWTTQVAGLTVYLPGAENQMLGSLVMGASRALYEQVVFNRAQVTSLDWITYPIMRFTDSPNVVTKVVQRTDLPSTGSGEPPAAPIAPAIANAFFDATGVRIRTAPMTPARVRAVLKAAGTA
jgi:CO/xanthine dehydrogenase Mo-binding subunit